MSRRKGWEYWRKPVKLSSKFYGCYIHTLFTILYIYACIIFLAIKVYGTTKYLMIVRFPDSIMCLIHMIIVAIMIPTHI